MNRTPSAADFEDENGVSSPNSTISSTSGKRSEREPIGEETEGERASCSRGSDDEDGNGGDTSRKKLRLSKEQSLVLEETFKEHSTLNPVSGSLVILLHLIRVFQSFKLGYGQLTGRGKYLCDFRVVCVMFVVLGIFLIKLWCWVFVCVSETKGGIGKATEPEGKTGGGVVSEQEGKVSNFL